MTEREAKIAALRWVAQTLEARAAVATPEDRPGLKVAVRMLRQQLERLDR